MIRGNIDGNMERKITITSEMKERIITEVKRAGYTQKRLAELIPIHSKYLSPILNGHREVSLDIVSRISAILHVRIEYLLCTDNIRTENELEGLYGYENIRAHNAMISFLESIGIKAQPHQIEAGKDSKVLEEEYYRIEGDPGIYKRIKTADQIYSPVFFFKDESGKDKPVYITTPEQAAAILNEFKSMAYSMMSSLIRTGAVNYDDMSDSEYHDLITRPLKADNTDQVIRRISHTD